MNVLEAEALAKAYPSFQLGPVSFAVREGSVTGLVGRNGAGKTTLLKSLMGQVHPDGGSVRFFGKEFAREETWVKKQVGFVSGAVDFYPAKTLSTLTKVTRRFYENWDEDAYRRYLELFRLEEAKKVRELSQGMKVKYLLALALSHHARLLILDEPTSGLDPVSRDELLGIFQDLVEREKVSVLFSTHLTSDLEKCADDIAYLREGKLAVSTDLESFLQAYRRVSGKAEALTPGLSARLIGLRRHRGSFEALIRREDKAKTAGLELSPATLEDIIVYLERG